LDALRNILNKDSVQAILLFLKIEIKTTTKLNCEMSECF